MMRRSSRQTPEKATNQLELLYDELEETEDLLEPLRDAQSEALGSEVADYKKKMEALGDGEIAPFRLSLLRREIRRLKTKAESLANDSFVVGTSLLRNEMDQIEQVLRPLKGNEAEALQSVKEATKKKLGSVSKQDVPALREEIDGLKEQAEALATRSFLRGEIERIEKIIDSTKSNRSKRNEAASLEQEKEDRKKELRSVDAYGLAALRKDIRDLKERAEALSDRESWFARLRRASGFIWLGIIPLVIVIYAIAITIWQWRAKPTIQAFFMETATAQTATAAAMPTATATLFPTPTPSP